MDEFKENKKENAEEEVEFFELQRSEVDDTPGRLDDSNLSDDFVIGKDFFIDSFEADALSAEEQKPIVKKSKHKKNRKKNGCLVSAVWMVVILVVALFAAGVLLFVGMDYLGISLASNAEVDVQVNIADGSSAGEITKQLKKAGIVDSSFAFRFYAKQGGYDSKFKSGIFYFNKQDSYEEIVSQLIKGGAKANEVQVTIPEGWTVDEIAKRLEENGVCTADQFIEAVNEASSSKYNYRFMTGIKSPVDGVRYKLEGYLFPDTYKFYNTNNKSGAEMAIRKMLENTNLKLTDEMYKRAEELGYSMHDILTLASVIEMEASVADYVDKCRVSAVFHNRLNNWTNPKLQSDPTTKYPYNTEKYDTYKIVGLAPGAYCSPSLESIKAALWPDEACKAYYFVTDTEMNFYFSETYDAHNAIIRKLKKEGKWA
ncbi:MAG: endolytic transglycosylase MltG [Ruminococcaceae bacterium]|nr:endolytic transglycosylase MltG [Oscillospiraceae bacterium]